MPYLFNEIMILWTLSVLFSKVIVAEATTNSNCPIGNACLLEVIIIQAAGGAKEFFQLGKFSCMEKFEKKGFMECLLNSAQAIINYQYDHYVTPCTNCEKETLKKLNDVLEKNTDEINSMDRSQLHRRLEKEGKWFQHQSPAWKRLLVNQTIAKLAQQELALGIDKMIDETKEIIFGSFGHLNADILTGHVRGIYSNPKATVELLEVQSLFKALEKGILGQLYINEKSKKFICTVLGKLSQSHVKQLIDELKKRLSQGRSEAGTYEEVKACDLMVHHFSGLLIFGSFVLWRVALAMQGEDMDFSDSKDFISTFRTLHTDFDIACSCSKSQIEVFHGFWRWRWSQMCYQAVRVYTCTGAGGTDHRALLCSATCSNEWEAKGFPSPQSRDEDNFIWENFASKCDAPFLLSAMHNFSGKGVEWFDYSIVNYTNWAPGEPRLKEGCVYYVQDEGTWKMEDCRDKLLDSRSWKFCFICERKVQKIIEVLPEIKLVQPLHQEMNVPDETLECDNNLIASTGSGRHYTSQGPGQGVYHTTSQDPEKERYDTSQGPGNGVYATAILGQEKGGCDAAHHVHITVFNLTIFLRSFFVLCN